MVNRVKKLWLRLRKMVVIGSQPPFWLYEPLLLVIFTLITSNFARSRSFSRAKLSRTTVVQRTNYGYCVDFVGIFGHITKYFG